LGAGGVERLGRDGEGRIDASEVAEDPHRSTESGRGRRSFAVQEPLGLGQAGDETLGVLEPTSLAAKLFLLADPKSCGIQLGYLEAQRVFALGTVTPRRSTLFQGLLCRTILRPQIAHLLPKPIRVGESVEHGELVHGFEEPLVFVLAMHVDEVIAEALQEADRHRRVVDEGTVSASPRELAAHEDLPIVGSESRLLENGESTAVAVVFEASLHGGRIRPGADDVGLGARPAQEEESVDQQGLAGARFAREDVQSRNEGDGDRVDDREISDAQLPQHQPMLRDGRRWLKTYRRRDTATVPPT
jgi:hypothetical protein